MTKSLFYFVFSLFLAGPGPAFAAAPLKEGLSLLTGQKQILPSPGKGQVLVFLSAVCPCSDSHLPEMRALAKDYPDFSFVAVHSNVDEEVADAKAYFEKARLPFPVLQDSEAKIADDLKALKTPHAYIVSPEGKILYQGGVSSSSNFAKAKEKPLRAALSDLQAGHEVRVAQARVLGCAISRDE